MGGKSELTKLRSANSGGGYRLPNLKSDLGRIVLTRRLNFKFDLGRIVLFRPLNLKINLGREMARRNHPVKINKFFSQYHSPPVFISDSYVKKIRPCSGRFLSDAHARAYCTLPKNAGQTINTQAWANSQKIMMMK